MLQLFEHSGEPDVEPGMVRPHVSNDLDSRELQLRGRTASSNAAESYGADGSKSSPSPSLGNFDRLWEFLSQDQDIVSPESSSGEQVSSDPDLDHKRQTGLQELKCRRNEPRRVFEDVERDVEVSFEVQENALLRHTTKMQRRQLRRNRLETSGTARGTNSASRAMVSETDSENEVSPLQAAATRIAVIQRLLDAREDPTARQPHLEASRTQGKLMTSQKLLMTNGTREPDSFLVPRRAIRSTVLVEDGHLAITARRKANLLKLLHEYFPQERKYLESTGSLRLPTSLSQAQEAVFDGIHVFVDISNILIGFHDTIKSSLGISSVTRIRHTPLSFHALSLILERGRPTSKRVVVGSDHLPSIDEARRLHYEISILERVQKAREPTTAPLRRKHASATSGASAPSSGSESITQHPRASHASPRRVEQAVDEILHLKMLESVVDAAAPSVIVLATGDAAEAEYSPGFRRMVERALAHGWAVELVSWARSIGAAWREEAWRARWGERFVVVELDAFCEELKAV